MSLRVCCELRVIARAGIVTIVYLWAALLFASPAEAASFSGKYDGIGTAVGMTLTLEEADDRVVGRFASGRGEPFSLNGRRTGDAAQGLLARGGQSFFFHIEFRPLGVQFLLIPKAPDGGPDMSGGTDYSFVQQGLQVPQPSAYQAAPPRGIDVDIINFIDAFRDWDPADMARIYASLDDRYKELIQLFDHAASEIVWRVCAASPPNASFSQGELDRLLERQRTECAPYLATVVAVRDAGLMNEFLRKANFQFELIRETVKCDRGRSPETKCADVSAMSSPLMVRWRRAPDIMSALVGVDEAPAVAERPVPVPVLTPVPAVSVTPTDAVAQEDGLNGEEADGDALELPTHLPRMRPGVRPSPQEHVQEAEPEHVTTSEVEDAPAPTSQAGREPIPDDDEITPEATVADELLVPVPLARPGVRLRTSDPNGDD